ncbi:calcium-binding protein [Yoonia sediminilitoris]|uniref:Hemolysin type calcium-binding protein n=1 Tax=Yoonia sediminilitoris TaxID=1286148 RepID=A0A2T6KR24_9RHOB|nr:calcium-binding protein [Yoonia sediminilitoris]PUB18999.1 hypothetical protein C8N45_101590 [Yoonia sediminilitoris]RCW99167.1 hypothetical protein DFP92_101590 [Yoonia sediminilitoris]
MATPINPGNVQDFDQPLNTSPDYTAIHVFSTADITATFDGQTQGDDGANFIDFSGANGTKVTKDGVTLYPIDSEFGFNVTDFSGAEQKTIDLSYTEGWAGDLIIGDVQTGLVISDAPTDVFKTPAVLGTWLTGLGDNTVKASTEHYSVMQNVLSDQKYPGDPDAVYPLDDNLILLSQNPDYDGQYVADLLSGAVEGVTVDDVNLDGVVDIKDLLNPNESTIEYDIAYSTDYSVTMKDDGKLLYRWGNAVKRPNDVRIEAQLPLPEEWKETDPLSELKSLFRVTAAELVVHHTITNNPNDQIRPEDFENESAIGTLPTYEVITDYDGDIGRTVWATTDDYYAGDGTLYPAGTILRDTMLADAVTGTLLDQIGAMSSDLELGFTNAWYTTMDREPFEPELDGDTYVTGPRWRLKPDKYGQDLPGVVIPIDPSDPLPITSAEVKYEVGAETQTVINLLDWATPISPLEISAGWQNNAGTVSANGLNLTDDFDIAFYIKGDVKPATIYSTELVMDYEEVTLHEVGAEITGTEGSDFLVGIGSNSFTGGAGEDLFVLSYGTSVTDVITASVVADFEVGVDKLGLIGFDALAGFNIDSVEDRALISQGVSGDDLTVSVDGELVATLTGVAAALGVGAEVDPGEGLSISDSFLITNPGPGEPGDDDTIVGTAGPDVLTGTDDSDVILGLAGNDYLYGLAGEDVLDGGSGLDRLTGGADADVFVFAEGTGLDIVYDYTDGEDMIQLDGIDFSEITISDYRTTGAILQAGSDRMILRNVDFTDITIEDFIPDDGMLFA